MPKSFVLARACRISSAARSMTSASFEISKPDPRDTRVSAPPRCVARRTAAFARVSVTSEQPRQDQPWRSAQGLAANPMEVCHYSIVPSRLHVLHMQFGDDSRRSDFALFRKTSPSAIAFLFSSSPTSAWEFATLSTSAIEDRPIEAIQKTQHRLFESNDTACLVDDLATDTSQPATQLKAKSDQRVVSFHMLSIPRLSASPCCHLSNTSCIV